MPVYALTSSYKDLGQTATADRSRCSVHLIYCVYHNSTSMLCELQVTWLHRVVGATNVRWLVSGWMILLLYTVSKRVWSVVQDGPSSQLRPDLVFPVYNLSRYSA